MEHSHGNISFSNYILYYLLTKEWDWRPIASQHIYVCIIYTCVPITIFMNIDSQLLSRLRMICVIQAHTIQRFILLIYVALLILTSIISNLKHVTSLCHVYPDLTLELWRTLIKSQNHDLKPKKLGKSFLWHGSW